MVDHEQEPEGSKRGELTYFQDDRGAKAFNQSFARVAGDHIKRHVAKFIPPKNVQHFQHGGDWRNPASPELVNTGMQKHGAELTTKFDDLIGGDLGLIDRVLSEITDAMSGQFAKMMYSTVGAAADAAGNVVNAKELGIPESFIAMLEKIELSADKDGKVEMPAIHATPGTAKKMLTELQAQPQAFQDRVEAIKAQKIKEARQREEDRKAKFVRYGD